MLVRPDLHLGQQASLSRGLPLHRYATLHLKHRPKVMRTPLIIGMVTSFLSPTTALIP